MAHIVMAHIAMAHIVMAYIVMAYILMAYSAAELRVAGLVTRSTKSAKASSRAWGSTCSVPYDQTSCNFSRRTFKSPMLGT